MLTNVSYSRILAGCLVFACCIPVSADTDVDFTNEIQPLIESACLRCHCAERTEAGLRLDSLAAALQGGDSGPALVAGRPELSSLYTLTVLAVDDESIMPPAEEPMLAKLQTERLHQWIAQGANWPKDAVLKVRPRMDFQKHIQPILESHCVACHRTDNSEGDYDLSTRSKAQTTGSDPPSLIAFQPQKSSLYTRTILELDDDELMPPRNAGGPLAAELAERLQLWISQGAIWPDGISLNPSQRKKQKDDKVDNLELVGVIRRQIVNSSLEKTEEEMVDYSSKVPLSGAQYHMVALKGGEFMMGSPAQEKHRKASEGPQVRVQVAPFWIGKYEVTWDEYEPFMVTQVDRRKDGSRLDYDPNTHTMVDAISGPTAPYMEMSFGMGQKGYPAISMTQHAANKYCQWLSAQTGHYYRLPTEAEWEYACRAGSDSAYSFGENPSDLDKHAWYYDNSDERYHPVGSKQPNAWGVYDMHGNVMEWTADQFAKDYFSRIKEQPQNPFLRPTSLYPRSVRGGGWDDDPEQLRSAARRGSDPAWKQQDPQLPKSIWYHTDAQQLGFRIVRPLNIPAIEEMNFFWNSAVGKR